jgi:tetratricopeptide (TPR) repeat protein
MSRHPVSAGGRADTADLKNALLARLGLHADAGDQEVEAARNALVDFLELAPPEMKTWAAARTADVDEAFALLSGPEQDLASSSAVAAIAQDGLDETPPPPRATPARSYAQATPATPKPRRNLIIGAVTAVAAVAVIFGVAQMGKTSVPGIDGTPTSSATTASGAPASVPVDPAKVAALMAKVAANPKDVVSFQSLGDLYFAAGDYKNASVWEQKILGVDPKNEKALLSLGAAQFNVGNTAEAKKHWLVAAKLYPNSAEVHYDLGFLYMSQTPPDKANMTAEWKKVVEIDPNSDLAKTVTQHLGSTAPTATPSAK